MPSIITQSRRAALLREFEESGLSMAAFCRRRELGYSTLASWRRVAREERDKDKDKDTAPRFVEIEAVMPEPQAWRRPDFDSGGSPGAHPGAGALLAELALPGGAVLRIFQVAGLAGAVVKGGVA